MERKDMIKVKVKLDKWKGYKLIQLYNNGLISAMNEENGLYGFFDIDGNVVIPFIYEEISGFYTKYSLVKKDKKYGVINRDGNIIVPIEYKDKEEAIKAICPEVENKYTFDRMRGINSKMPCYKKLQVVPSANDLFTVEGERLEETKALYISDISEVPENCTILERLAYYTCLSSSLYPNSKIEIENYFDKEQEYKVAEASRALMNAEEQFMKNYALIMDTYGSTKKRIKR